MKTAKTAHAFAARAIHAKPVDIENPAIRELMDMHTFCRPAYGKTEKAFIARYIDSLPNMTRDKEGNRFVRLGNARVAWSSHTDTVHKAEGYQRLAYGDGLLSLADGVTSNCLGADDSAGVWIMRQMIIRKIPGLYIFHAAEEIGGIGSAYIARHTPELLENIDCAIALDRRGTSSVITHQFDRCASDDFAESLAKYLGGAFAPDDSGTFTDTANYVSLVPECTNLSVGYYGAHSAAEMLDIGFCAELLEKLCALDTATLPIARDPSDCEYLGGFGDERVSQSLVDLVYDHPESAAELMAEYGITADIFERFLTEARGRYR